MESEAISINLRTQKWKILKRGFSLTKELLQPRYHIRFLMRVASITTIDKSKFAFPHNTSEQLGLKVYAVEAKIKLYLLIFLK